MDEEIVQDATADLSRLVVYAEVDSLWAPYVEGSIAIACLRVSSKPKLGKSSEPWQESLTQFPGNAGEESIPSDCQPMSGCIPGRMPKELRPRQLNTKPRSVGLSGNCMSVAPMWGDVAAFLTEFGFEGVFCFQETRLEHGPCMQPHGPQFRTAWIAHFRPRPEMTLRQQFGVSGRCSHRHCIAYLPHIGYGFEPWSSTLAQTQEVLLANPCRYVVLALDANVKTFSLDGISLPQHTQREGVWEAFVLCTDSSFIGFTILSIGTPTQSHEGAQVSEELAQFSLLLPPPLMPMPPCASDHRPLLIQCNLPHARPKGVQHVCCGWRPKDAAAYRVDSFRVLPSSPDIDSFLQGFQHIAQCHALPPSAQPCSPLQVMQAPKEAADPPGRIHR
eukprot:6035577-Amphidinium_carterae.2